MRAVLLMGLLSFLVACSSARGPEGNATEKTAPDFSKPFPLTRDLWGTPTYPSFVVVLESDLSPEDKARLQNCLGKTAFYDAQRKFYYIERHPENQWFKLPVKVLATPLVVVVDGVGGILVVGVSVVGGGSLFDSHLAELLVGLFGTAR